MIVDSAVRILCISPFFPPIANSESFCAGKLVEALLNAGLDVSVLYCSNIHRPKHLEDPSSLWRFPTAIASDVVIPAHNNRLRSLLQAVQYRTHIYVRWIDAVVRFASQLHAQRKFDLVYSRSLPAVAHFAGFWCADRLKLPWIVNMNDPWDCFLVPERSHEASFLYSTVSTYWLKKTLNKADVVIYPNKRLHQYHRKMLKIDTPAVIIPHIGYSFSILNEPPQPTREATFHLVHAGKLGSNEKPRRSTNSLLIGLCEFLTADPEARHVTKLTLVGPEDPQTTAQICRLGLQPNVEVVGPVSYEESLRYIRSATVCVLVEAQFHEGIFLPSKLVDYIAARKPVLALSPRIGVVADLAAQGGIVRVDPGATDAIRVAISSLYSDFKNGTIKTRTPGDDLVSLFDPQRVAGQFREVLQQLLKLKGPARLGKSPFIGASADVKLELSV